MVCKPIQSSLFLISQLLFLIKEILYYHIHGPCGPAYEDWLVSWYQLIMYLILSAKSISNICQHKVLICLELRSTDYWSQDWTQAFLPLEAPRGAVYWHEHLFVWPQLKIRKSKTPLSHSTAMKNENQLHCAFIHCILSYKNMQTWSLVRIRLRFYFLLSESVPAPKIKMVLNKSDLFLFLWEAPNNKD